MLELLPGDIILGRPGSKMGWGVVIFESLFGDPAEFSHVGVCTKEGYLGATNAYEQPFITEALARVECAPFSRNWDGRNYTIYRPTYLSPAQLECLAAKAEEYIGRPYGFWKLILIAGDAWLSRKYRKDMRVFSRLLHREGEPICSFLVQDVYYDCGNEDFGVPKYTAQPDDIGDWCASRTQLYTKIAEVK